MNRDQIDFLKSLDPLGMDGSIQVILLDPNITAAPFEKVARIVMKNLKAEKDFLVMDNIKLSRKLNEERNK